MGGGGTISKLREGRLKLVEKRGTRLYGRRAGTFKCGSL